MPPPPPKTAGPGEEFLTGHGHWVWTRDEGFSDIQYEHVGMLGSSMAWLTQRSPEQWFVKVSDARWETKEAATSPIFKNGSVSLLEIGRESPEKLVKGLDGRDYKGHVKAYWEGDRLCVHTYGTSKDSQVNWLSIREIQDGECHNTIEDKVHNLKGMRIFTKYPYYSIDNQTRKTLTLATYSTADFMLFYPTMRKEIKPGLQIIEASSSGIEEETGWFVMTTRDTTAGSEEKIYNVKLTAFDSLVLTVDMFTQV